MCFRKANAVKVIYRLNKPQGFFLSLLKHGIVCAPFPVVFNIKENDYDTKRKCIAHRRENHESH